MSMDASPGYGIRLELARFRRKVRNARVSRSAVCSRVPTYARSCLVICAAAAVLAEIKKDEL